MNAPKILIATDVPYWRRSTGAEQRIAALVDYLVQQLFLVRTFFISQIDPDDEVQISSQRLDVVAGSSANPPTDKIKRLRWYSDATVNQFKVWLNKEQKQDNDQISKGLQLDDFRWPWAIDQFSECVSEFDPDSILIEYIKLSYLMEGLTQTQRTNIKLMIDTHDAVHIRNQEFTERGFSHWLNISRQQEAEVLRKFDYILAIQPFEAALFREMAPQSKTIVVGHSLEQQISRPIEQRQSKHTLVAGYIGSENFSNSSAITNLLQNWAKTESNANQIRLRIAGSICTWLAEELGAWVDSFDNVVLMGPVADLAAFYESVDLVINPVEFGTGLKIKNCEALCYGLPLLTTRNGSQTMPPKCEKFMIIVDSHEEMVQEICRLANDRESLDFLRNQLSNVERPLFSAEAAYSELLETLRS